MISEGLSSIPQISDNPSSFASQPSFPEWKVDAPQFKNGNFIKPKREVIREETGSLHEPKLAEDLNLPKPVEDLNLALNTQIMFEGWEYVLRQTRKHKKKNINSFDEVKHWKKEGKQEELAPYKVLKNTIQLISDVELAVSRLDKEDIGNNLKLEEFKKLMKRDRGITKYWESFFYEDGRKVFNQLSIELIDVVANYYVLARKNIEIDAYLEDERKEQDKARNMNYTFTSTPLVDPGIRFLTKD